MIPTKGIFLNICLKWNVMKLTFTFRNVTACWSYGKGLPSISSRVWSGPHCCFREIRHCSQRPQTYILPRVASDVTLQWRHNVRDSVSNHQPHDCLLNRLFRRRSKKTSKLRVTGLCARNSPGTIWWRHHEITAFQTNMYIHICIITAISIPWYCFKIVFNYMVLYNGRWIQSGVQLNLTPISRQLRSHVFPLISHQKSYY